MLSFPRTLGLKYIESRLHVLQMPVVGLEGATMNLGSGEPDSCAGANTTVRYSWPSA